MRNKNKNVEESHDKEDTQKGMHKQKMKCGPRHMHPHMMHKMRKFGRHGPMSFMNRGSHRNPMMELHDVESKEEAIEVMELQTKRLQKHRSRLQKKMKRLDSLEEHIEETIAEVGKMKEFTKEEFKSILKKKSRSFEMKMLEEED